MEKVARHKRDHHHARLLAMTVRKKYNLMVSFSLLTFTFLYLVATEDHQDLELHHISRRTLRRFAPVPAFSPAASPSPEPLGFTPSPEAPSSPSPPSRSEVASSPPSTEAPSSPSPPPRSEAFSSSPLTRAPSPSPLARAQPPSPHTRALSPSPRARALSPSPRARAASPLPPMSEAASTSPPPGTEVACRSPRSEVASFSPPQCVCLCPPCVCKCVCESRPCTAIPPPVKPSLAPAHSPENGTRFEWYVQLAVGLTVYMLGMLVLGYKWPNGLEYWDQILAIPSKWYREADNSEGEDKWFARVVRHNVNAVYYVFLAVLFWMLAKYFVHPIIEYFTTGTINEGPDMEGVHTLVLTFRDIVHRA